MSDNALKNNILSIGQNLKIRDNGVVVEECFGEENTYTVVKGDTLYSIARKFNTTVDNIKKKNNLVDNTINSGQILNI